MSITFHQYLAPNGRVRALEIDRPETIERMAEAIERCGCKFDAEILSDGQVSFTVSDGERDIAIVLSPNGREVEHAVDLLVERAAKLLGVEVA